MPYKDDDWSIFPTRNGVATGSANERQMLDAIGGAESFRTRLMNNADGSTTLLRTKGGMPQFESSSSGRSGEVVESEAIFYGTPASEAYPTGYTPPSQNPLVGPHSKWTGYPSRTSSPDAYGGADSGAGKLEPFALDVDSRGCLTWYSPLITVGDGVPVVISWRGPGTRAGKYCKTLPSDLPIRRIHGADIGEWTDKNNNNMFLQIGGFTGFDTRVWVGHGLVLDTGLAVYSAAIKKEASEVYLYVISDRSVFRGAVSLFESSGQRTTLKTGHVVVAMTQVGTVSVPENYWRYIQAPFINDDCTKAALLVDASDDGIGEWQLAGGYAKTRLYELDLASSSSSYKAESKTEFVHAAINTSIDYIDIPNTHYHYISNNDVVSRGRVTKHNLSAADYRDGMLVWLFVDITTYGLDKDVHISSVAEATTGSFYCDFEIAVSGGILVSLVHSEDGVVLSRTIDNPAASKVFYSESGGGASTSPQTTWEIGAGTVFNIFEYDAYLCNADLRTDCLAAIMRAKSIAYTGSAISGSNPAPLQGGGKAWGNTKEERDDFISLLLVFGNDMSSGIQEYSAASIENTGLYVAVTPIIVPQQNPYSANYAQPATTTYSPRITPFSVIGGGNDSYQNSQQAVINGLSPYCHIATDHKRRVAYIGWDAIGNAYQKKVIESFYFNGSGTGPLTEAVVPTAKYSPGGFSSIYNPVFFPEYVTKVWSF